MNKSVLVIDTPISCMDCPLSFDDKACYITETYITETKFKPEADILDDCPLKELPSKEVCNEYDFEHYKNGVAQGWNNCIDNILK